MIETAIHNKDFLSYPLSILILTTRPAKITDNKIEIKCDLFNHEGKCLFREALTGHAEQHHDLSIELGNKIIKEVGQLKINQLNTLKDDFDYTP